MKCPVPFCRKECPILPEGIEVLRGSGHAYCEICHKELKNHKEYAYSTGMGHCIKACDGKFYHL